MYDFYKNGSVAETVYRAVVTDLVGPYMHLLISKGQSRIGVLETDKKENAQIAKEAKMTNQDDSFAKAELEPVLESQLVEKQPAFNSRQLQSVQQLDNEVTVAQFPILISHDFRSEFEMDV